MPPCSFPQLPCPGLLPSPDWGIGRADTGRAGLLQPGLGDRESRHWEGWSPPAGTAGSGQPTLGGLVSSSRDWGIGRANTGRAGLRREAGTAVSPLALLPAPPHVPQHSPEADDQGITRSTRMVHHVINSSVTVRGPVLDAKRHTQMSRRGSGRLRAHRRVRHGHKQV